MNISETRQLRPLENISRNLRQMGDDEFLVFRQMTLQEANRRAVGEMLVTVVKRVPDIKQPFIVVPWGDIHAGSGATQWEVVDERVRSILRVPGVYVIGVGDWIESIDPDHGVDTLQNSLPLYDQIRLVRGRVIGPLSEGGRLLALVRGHRAHEGALSSITGDDTWRRMVEGYEVPLLANGGVLDLTLEDDRGGVRHMRNQCYHNTAGRSGNNPIRPLERVARGFSPGNVPDAIVAAHDHVGGGAMEMGTALLRGGTPKGNRENPDPYGISLGLDGTNPSGQGLLVWANGVSRGRDFEVVPYMDRRMGLAALSAMRIWESLEQQGIAREVVEEVRAGDGKVDVVFSEGESVTSISDKWDFDGEDREPQYQKAVWDVKTRLPIGLFVLANMRFGSRTHDDDQERWVKEILSREDVVWVAGRQLVDRKVPKDEGRENWVDKALTVMETGKGRNLGVLYDAVLKSEAWNKPVKAEGEVISEPMLAVSQIVREMDTVIVEHMGTIGVRLGKSDVVGYTVSVLDNLENRGSTAFATGGLMSVYRDRLDAKPGVVMGGHMPGAGTAQFFDGQNPETSWPVMVAPGWMAKRSNWKQSAATESPADELGPGVILMPGGLKIFQNDYAVLPVGRKEQWVMLDALTVLSAIRLGLMDGKKLTGRK